MPTDTGHGDTTTTPGLPEIKLERIIFHILIASRMLLYDQDLRARAEVCEWWSYSPEREHTV
jgi:hypothetical protein